MIFQLLKDYGEVISITLVPFIIWYVGVKFQNRSKKQQAKIDLFLTLMADRKKNPPTVDFADSLNKIDVVFQTDRKVRSAWRAYYDSLHPNSQHNAISNSFLLDLLSEIANSLNYNDLKQTEIDRFYVPMFFVNQVNNQDLVSNEFLRVLKNSENFGISFPSASGENDNNPTDAEVVS